MTDVLEPTTPSALPVPWASQRGLAEELVSRLPIGLGLPALYHEDSFIQRLTTVFDAALDPVVVTLDCIDGYYDPYLCPPDFLVWLSGWVGLVIDDAWPPERRRQLVADAVKIYRSRGTVQALAAAVELYTGVIPEIIEHGGHAWSTTAGSALPGSAGTDIVVRVVVPDQAQVERRILDVIVEENKPVHLSHRIEILGTV
jgi:phage tail-like protein